MPSRLEQIIGRPKQSAQSRSRLADRVDKKRILLALLEFPIKLYCSLRAVNLTHMPNADEEMVYESCGIGGVIRAKDSKAVVGGGGSESRLREMLVCHLRPPGLLNKYCGTVLSGGTVLT